MVDVAPFSAWRYDLAQAGELSDVIAPPYDVIDPSLQEQLYQRHPYNAVRLILNRAEPDDRLPSDRTARARLNWKQWKQDQLLQREHNDALYVYHQEYLLHGQPVVRRGFLARLRLEELGTGQVFPHERTLAGPKADQLALMDACRAQLSPIFGLYPDETCQIQQRLDDACLALPGLQAVDHAGVKHRLWVLHDLRAIDATREALRSQPVFIADGHHRYETALQYSRQCREQRQVPDELAPENFVLSALFSLQDAGLSVLPTQRVIRGAAAIGLTATELARRLEPHFLVEMIPAGASAAALAWEAVATENSQDVLAFGTADGHWLVARLADPDIMLKLAPDHSNEWRSLAVSVLHQLVLGSLLPPEVVSEGTIQYVHEWQAAASSEESLVCLVPAVHVTDVAKIAAQREFMPPKSTYFYPKLLSGLVFYGLE